jgi:hypothetical protein
VEHRALSSTAAADGSDGHDDGRSGGRIGSVPDPVLELLHLLAEDASAEELDEQARKLTADDPDHGPAARELALRVRA